MQLENQRLCVEIAEPGTLYRGSRFDWSGFITQVTLDGKHTFCAPESIEKNGGTGGRGLCNEFGIFRPVGYQSARPGQWFPKFGVGLLRRPDEDDYKFDRPYEFQPFPLEVRRDAQKLVFQFEPLPCRGYAARLRKTLRLNENALSIEYELENIGSQPICTGEYVHNFLAPNGAPPGPQSVLQLHPGLRLQRGGALLRQSGAQVRWNAPVKAPQIWEIAAPAPTSGMIWQLWHESEKIGLSESLDVPIERVSLWCAPHVLSPEVFVNIAVLPGQSQRWARRYQFWAGERITV